MNRKTQRRRHQRRLHEQEQHGARKLEREVSNQLSEATTVLKRRKKKVETHIDAEMAKRGFTRDGDGWKRVTTNA